MKTNYYIIVTKDDPWNTLFLQNIKRNIWTEQRNLALIFNSKHEAETTNKKFKGIIKEVEINHSSIIDRAFTVLDWRDRTV